MTGCSSGIGTESALELKRRGFHVLAGCRKPDDVERMNSMGFTGVLIDLDSPESVDRAADEVIALTDNCLYGIFNNAGFGMYGPFHHQPCADGTAVFRQLFGAHQLTMRLLPAMLPHGEGRIVMTSSVMGLISTPGRGAYAASKYALEAWSDALRMELRHSGIKVSLIETVPFVLASPTTSIRRKVINQSKITASPPALRWDRKRWSTKCAMLLLARSRRCAIR
ncbi:hypothetical protein DMI66_22035 [Escherichia coli]|nr:hypothetical protein [Escherichia coli]